MKCRMRLTTWRRRASSSMLLTQRSLPTIQPTTITVSTTRLDSAMTTFETSRTRVDDCRMPKNLEREAGARLRLADCSDQAKHLHRLEHALHIATAAVIAT